MCRRYQKKFQAEYMSTDHKPKGKMRRAIEKSNRMAGREEIRDELDSLAELSDNSKELVKED